LLSITLDCAAASAFSTVASLRFGFELRLFDLLLLQRQRVLHGIGLRLGADHARFGIRFGALDLLRLCGIGLQLGDFHLLLVNGRLEFHALAFLFLQQDVFEALGVFRGQVNVAQKHFLDHDSVRAQPVGDRLRRSRAEFVALHGEYFAHYIVGCEVAKRRGHHRRDDFGIHRLRQVGVDVRQLLWIEAVAHGNGKADGQAFASLHGQEFVLRRSIGHGVGGEKVVAQVISFQALDEGKDQMHAGIQRLLLHPRNLADAHPSEALRHHGEAHGH
jgi:hypothetical protein